VGTCDLRRFQSAEDLAAAAALELAALWSGREQEVLCIALLGGRIAGRFFTVLAGVAQKQAAGLDQIEFFWSDERCVPPEDPESNFGLARDRLLLPLRIPENRIHRIRGESPPEDAAQEAAAELCRLTSQGPNEQPVLDLVLLGMGEDGHVASLFPGEAEKMVRNPAVFRPVISPKPPPSRITLGYPAIQAARQVWVLVSGPGKENALEESVSPSGRTPLARVIGARSDVRVWTDISLKI